MASIMEALQAAVAHQQQGRLDQAAQLYEKVLAVDPQQVDALHLLGLIEVKRGDPAQGIRLIQQAAALRPDSVILSNLGVMLKQVGRLDEAAASYRRSIELDPSNADAYFNLGKTLKEQGQLDQAEQLYRKSIELLPSKAAPWLSLMNVYANGYKIDDAIEIAIRAEAQFPNNVEILLNAGAIYKRAQNYPRTIELYQRVVALDPTHVDALCRIATTLINNHRLDEAQPYLQRAQAIAPESEFVQCCLGSLHSATGNNAAAVEAYERAAKQCPTRAVTFSSLATAQRKVGKLTEALASAQTALRLDPTNSESLAIAGGVYLTLGRFEDAMDLMRKAIDQRKGAYRDAHHNLLMCMQYTPEITPQQLLAEHRRWASAHGHPPEGVMPREQFALPDADAPIRLGFVSADIGLHPVGYFTARLFESIDRTRFQTFVYSDRKGEDALTQRLTKVVDRWRNTIQLSDLELLEQIRADKIDVLFDLAGHTALNRMPIFVRRAAPVQITWAGYVGTTGLDTIDYLLADRFHTPPGCEANYHEPILRMPDGYVTYMPPDGTPEVNDLPALSSGVVTFGALCNPSKVNPQVIECWCRILGQVPNSRLLLAYSGWQDASNQQRVEHEMARWNCGGRVDFEHREGATAAMSLYQRMDIALDTFPYSGGLTTCEALWMGVPTITCPGDRFAGRHAFSHLSVAGVTECIARDRQEMIDKAVELAKDLPRLAQMRRGLRDRLIASPLFDGPRFARNFEAIMLQVARRPAASTTVK